MYQKKLLRRKRFFKKFIPLLFKILLILIPVGIIGIFIIIGYFARQLPPAGTLVSRIDSSTVFYDRTGKVLFELYQDKNRIPISINNVPLKLRQATISIEDRAFYSHPGFSITGILRAFYSTIFRQKTQGGSTLTQQLVKNVFLTQERTLTRKVKELILAIEIERRYSKDQILEMYLNEAPYGGQYWGIESASKGYFGKSSADLNLVESAFLAGLPQKPSIYSPFIGTAGAYVPRTINVLRRMREDGYITKNEEQLANQELLKLKFKKPYLAIKAPHFVFYVKKLIEEQFGPGILNQGIKVKTSLDSQLQDKAERVVNSEIKKIKNLKVSNGSAIILDVVNSQILAMVGSYDFNDEKFGNYNASLGYRQPGSAIKPITYTAGFEKGYTPSTLLMDVDTVFPDQGDKVYQPVNYDGKFHGPVELRYALANSYNIPAVKLLALVGVKSFLQKANDFGLSSFAPSSENLKRFGLAITLGGGETRLLDMTNAFAVFGRAGVIKQPISILEIKDYQGKIIYKANDQTGKKVISSEIAFLISDILSDNNARSSAFGSNSYLQIPGKTVAVKTGTSNDKRDNWTLGYTKEVAVGVWVGNNDNSPMDPRVTSGITGASPIWHKLMVQSLTKYKDGLPDMPDGIIKMEVDSLLGGLPRDNAVKREEYFVKGTEPTAVSPFLRSIKISKTNGKLANDTEIKTGDYEEKTFIIFYEYDPVSKDGENRWQKGINDWIATQSDPIYKAPSEISDAKADQTIIVFKQPVDQTRIDSNDFKLQIKVVSVKSISEAILYVNGSEYKKYQGDLDTVNEDIHLDSGRYEIVFKAFSGDGQSGQNGVRIGVNTDWQSPSPTMSLTPIEILSISP